MRGIGELTELMKSILPITTPISVPQLPSPEHMSVNGHTAPPSIVAEVLPPPSSSQSSSEVRDDPIRQLQNSSGQDSQNSGKIDFGKMKNLLERKMGSNRSEDMQSSEEESVSTPRTGSHSPSTSPQVQRKTQTKPSSAAAPPVPKRAPLPPNINQGHDNTTEQEKKGVPAAEEVLSELPPQLPPKKGRKRPPPPSVGGVFQVYGNLLLFGFVCILYLGLFHLCSA